MQTSVPDCPLCGGPSAPHGQAILLDKHPAEYLRCTACGFIWIKECPWLAEVYENAISVDDTGLLARCADVARRTSIVARAEGITGGRFLDWGGGYGTLTRMMRDRGYTFFHSDAYCQNLFALEFEGDLESRYDLITASEVLEHLVYPSKDLEKVFSQTDRLLATTVLLPEPAPRPDEWWYFGTEHGQHVAFHTERSLRLLAESHGFRLTTDGTTLHLMHRDPLSWQTRLVFSRRARALRWKVGKAARAILR